MQALFDRFKRDGFGATRGQYAVIALLTAIALVATYARG
jgi:Flp pilus assembly pilin Flp